MASTKQVKVDPQELKRAEVTYVNFIEASKKSIIAIVLVLILLAIAFV